MADPSSRNERFALILAGGALAVPGAGVAQYGLYDGASTLSRLRFAAVGAALSSGYLAPVLLIGCLVLLVLGRREDGGDAARFARVVAIVAAVAITVVSLYAAGELAYGQGLFNSDVPGVRGPLTVNRFANAAQLVLCAAIAVSVALFARAVDLIPSRPAEAPDA